ncbi:hypothetical protein CAPTEDRAFT_174027 [Capitella teleta]|uniref:DUF2452 domain-containing protein n=1 Tax=Capitella teleta TaxID=283909 RepID=R7U5J2_CAPTE|nr:hypothetical protein CAPTEDRAFT_174027 [Capitella teleta]|eukprot:ELU01640.1 hypothetical protein CAPTEDRAFT_174027 [Capitella teleta]
MEKPTDMSAVALVETNAKPLGLQLVNSYMTNKKSSPQDLVELAHQVSKADEFVRANAGNKLSLIAEQIKYLQEQARKVLEEAKKDADLHHAACNIVKKPGTTYNLYKRESGQAYLSILSPEEWGPACPHEYVGSWRLEFDQSWTPLKDVERRDQENLMVTKVLDHQLALGESDFFSGLTGEKANVQALTAEQKS